MSTQHHPPATHRSTGCITRWTVLETQRRNKTSATAAQQPRNSPATARLLQPCRPTTSSRVPALPPRQVTPTPPRPLQGPLACLAWRLARFLEPAHRPVPHPVSQPAPRCSYCPPWHPAAAAGHTFPRTGHTPPRPPPPRWQGQGRGPQGCHQARPAPRPHFKAPFAGLPHPPRASSDSLPHRHRGRGRGRGPHPPHLRAARAQAPRAMVTTPPRSHLATLLSRWLRAA